MDAIELMRKEMSRRRLRDRTIESYCFCLNRFFDSFDKEKDRDYRKITKKEILDYLNHLSEQKLSGSTMNIHLCAIKFFFQEVMHRNISINIKYSRRPNILPIVLSKEEIKKLLDNIGNLKHRFMIAFMYSTGLRVSELVNFRVRDLELDKKIGWVRDGKGGKDRQIIISDKLLDGLKRQVVYSKNAEDYLFLTNRGKQYSVRTIDIIVKKAGRKAKINKKIHPHTLRHSFATHLIQNGNSVGDVQQVMGHNSAQTTMIYVHCAANMLNIKSPFDSL